MRPRVLTFAACTAVALAAIAALAYLASAPGEYASDEADGTSAPDAAPAPPQRAENRRRRSPPPTSDPCALYGLGTSDGGGCNCVDQAYTGAAGHCVCVAGHIQVNAPSGLSSICIPSPSGVAVANDYANGVEVTYGYCPKNNVNFVCAFTDASTYVNSISIAAIYVPIVQLLPDAGGITDWTDASAYAWSFNGDAGNYMDTLIQTALDNGKSFSLSFGVGYQSTSPGNVPSYLSSLPARFEAQCNPGGSPSTACAPLFHWWKANAGGGACLTSFVPLPWNSNVQQFWIQLANAVVAHLKSRTTDAGASWYSSLVLVHLPGLSIYDEELRLPTAVYPTTAPASDSGVTCVADPDGAVQLAASVINEDAYAGTYAGYGHGSTWDAATLLSGITNIASGYGAAFDRRVIVLSLFDPGTTAKSGLDFPDLIDDAAVTDAGVGDFALRIVTAVAGPSGVIDPSRVMLQADDLASPNRSATSWVLPEVAALAAQLAWTPIGFSGAVPVLISWQTNKEGSNSGTLNLNPNTHAVPSFLGANCNGQNCQHPDWDGSTTASTYWLLMGEGQDAGAIYLEVFPADVVNDPYPSSFDAQAPLYLFYRK